MSESSARGPRRSRFANVARWGEVERRHYDHPGGRYAADHWAVASAVGARALGFGVVSLEPGKASCPYHFHHLEEELFVVLEGRGVLRQGDEEGEERVALEPGDFVSFPAGTGIAHQFVNEGDGPFVYLALSNLVEGDAAEYPDSDKILFRKTRLMVRRSPRLDYFEGED